MTQGPARPARTAAASYRAPLWVRGLLATDRVASRMANVVASLRDEALLAWIPPEERTSLTAVAYADLSTYLPGGTRFRRGLFPWEEHILSSPPFPSSGRVLLGAAGAGRELVALVERGYEVVAFDPCLPFVEAARSVVPDGKAKVVQASYREMVDAVAGQGGGELAPLLTSQPFDAAILGWGSLSHVTPASERAALLRALRVLVPLGPVLASFLLLDDSAKPANPGDPKGRVRSALRRAFAALGAPGPSEDHDHYAPKSGFFTFLTRDELVKLARGAGFEIALWGEGDYPHALLVPQNSGKLPKRKGLRLNDGADGSD